MADRPIIFSAPMVRALLDGRKTQTRRLFKRRRWVGEPCIIGGRVVALHYGMHKDAAKVARYSRGDRLWVREAVRAEETDDYDRVVEYQADGAYRHVTDHLDVSSEAFGRWWLLKTYRSTDPDLDGNKPVPSIHMPRWASRLTLTVTEVRVERLQAITEEDARAEGIGWSEFTEGWTTDPDDGGPHYHGSDPTRSFASLWTALHGPGAWDANPWVVALTFTVGRHNIDAPAG